MLVPNLSLIGNKRICLTSSPSLMFADNMATINLEPKATHESLMPAGKLLFTVQETADILSIHTKSVRRLLERGLLKANPALRHKLITRESIEAFARMTL
jgi:hypothetical protein